MADFAFMDMDAAETDPLANGVRWSCWQDGDRVATITVADWTDDEGPVLEVEGALTVVDLSGFVHMLARSRRWSAQDTYSLAAAGIDKWKREAHDAE